MKARLLMVGLLAAAAAWGGPVRAQVDDLDRVFRDASTAYDEGRYADAVGGFQALVENGVVSREVQFNLGNALYRAGQVGPAVLAYRRAWRLAPRDTDVQANLRFVMGETNAVISRTHPLASLLQRISLPGWWASASAGWWLLWIAVAGAAIAPRLRPVLLRVAAGLAVLAAVSVAGILQWSYAPGSREAVVTPPQGTHARYAPLETAEAHFALPAGSIVRLRETSDAWLRVSIDDREGWIEKTAATPVS